MRWCQSPILLFPCGHSLCKQCLAHHLAASHKKTCALCRAPIQSQAVNISLQQLIQSMQGKRQALKQQQKQRAQAAARGADGEGSGLDLDSALEDTDASRYVQLFHQSSMRCAVLATRLADLTTSCDQVQSALRASEIVVQHMEQEEDAVQKRLAAAQAELQLVQQHLTAQRDRQSELRDQHQRQADQYEHVRQMLEPLERERDKAELIVRRLAPEVKLERPVVQPPAPAPTPLPPAGSSQTNGDRIDQATSANRPVDYRALAGAAAAVGADSPDMRPTSSSKPPAAAAPPRSTSNAPPFSQSAYPWTFPARPGR